MATRSRSVTEAVDPKWRARVGKLVHYDALQNAPAGAVVQTAEGEFTRVPGHELWAGTQASTGAKLRLSSQELVRLVGAGTSLRLLSLAEMDSGDLGQTMPQPLAQDDDADTLVEARRLIECVRSGSSPVGLLREALTTQGKPLPAPAGKMPAKHLEEGDLVAIGGSGWKVMTITDQGATQRLELSYIGLGVWPGSRADTITVNSDLKIGLLKL